MPSLLDCISALDPLGLIRHLSWTVDVGIIVDQPSVLGVRVGPAGNQTPLLAAAAKRVDEVEAVPERPVERLLQGRDVEVLQDATALALDPQWLVLERKIGGSARSRTALRGQGSSLLK